MNRSIIKPSLLLETSWEVCNKQGGIYTVLTSRALEMIKRHDGRVVFIGPWLSKNDKLPLDFDDTVPDLLKDWQKNVSPTLGLNSVCGCWRIPGAPPVILVDFEPLYDQKPELYFEMWQQFGIQSDKGYGDYDEASLFGIAAAKVMQSVHSYLCPQEETTIGIFNEWMLGMGLLYSKLYNPAMKTLFITHATTVGRSIAGNNKALYAYMEGYNGDQMASELGVEAKHGIEKTAAWQADCFATVSGLTARECRQLIGRDPVVLPNGFEPNFVPQGKDYTSQRNEARRNLLRSAENLTGEVFPKDTLLVATSGRYEYRNKGLDLFIDAMVQSDLSGQLDRKIIAFVMVPAWVAEPRADLRYLMSHLHIPKNKKKALPYPFLTHWLHNMNEDAITNRLDQLTSSSEHIHFIFIPCYLDGNDGIFNRSYYELLIGMDLTIFPSYYEPWGYTPLESIAFHVPTVTTNLSGFGLWAMQERECQKKLGKNGVAVIERTDFNYDKAASDLAAIICEVSRDKKGQAERRKKAKQTASYAEWHLFYDRYEEAYTAMLEEEGKEK